ncbi:MAG: TIR domain-containing protein [Verrucomicrobia bacterium]|nr:TIR domain-containing protein [Verrucomicrobiota bacterium]
MSDSPTSSDAAVFLSYAHEDTDAARRIAEALRSQGVEVWFDQNELRGGDAWDAKIKKQVRACTLFLPLVSQHTQERGEGYFRREWNLAVERTHDMVAGIPFIVLVVIDDTSENGAAVPEEFLRYQWTRLPAALPTPQFVEQVKRLLTAPRRPVPSQKSDVRSQRSEGGNEGRAALASRRRPAIWLLAGAAVLAVGIAGYFTLGPTTERVRTAGDSKPENPISKPVDLAPAKSIAVLPFANMSPETENAFFADGVHEDVLTNLAKIRDLKVISRTSVLAYRDTAQRNLKKIAAELGVANVLEGSVRRAGNKVRVTVQLIDARTDQHLWAEKYDRDLTDIFAVQSAVAEAIAAALQAQLTPDERQRLAAQPTTNIAAYDLYLRARQLIRSHEVVDDRTTIETAIALLEKAVGIDPRFALAYLELGSLHRRMYSQAHLDPRPERSELARAAVERAAAVAPELPELRLARAAEHARRGDNVAALAEFEAAKRLMPNNAEVFAQAGWILRSDAGQMSRAMGNLERSVELDPRNANYLYRLYANSQFTRDFDRAAWAYEKGSEISESMRVVKDDTVAWLRFRQRGELAPFVAYFDSTPFVSAEDPRRAYLRCLALLYARRFSEVVRVVENLKSPWIAPGANRYPKQFFALAAYAYLGDRAAAQRAAEPVRAYYREALEKRTDIIWASSQLALTEAYAGETARARQQAEETKRARAGSLSSERHYLAMVQAQTGGLEPAMDEVEKLIREPSFLSIPQLRFDPVWDPLRGMSRFKALLAEPDP